MCRSRGELSNAYLLAKFGFDTAENQPSKVLRAHAEQRRRAAPRRPRRDSLGDLRRARSRRVAACTVLPRVSAALSAAGEPSV